MQQYKALVRASSAPLHLAHAVMVKSQLQCQLPSKFLPGCCILLHLLRCYACSLQQRAPTDVVCRQAAQNVDTAPGWLLISARVSMKRQGRQTQYDSYPLHAIFRCKAERQV
jgi:hypothetical protein